MSESELSSGVRLDVDGGEVSREIIDSIISLEVDDCLTLPSMFSVHIQDPKLILINGGTFAVGKGLDIFTVAIGKEKKS